MGYIEVFIASKIFLLQELTLGRTVRVNWCGRFWVITFIRLNYFLRFIPSSFFSEVRRTRNQLIHRKHRKQQECWMFCDSGRICAARVEQKKEDRQNLSETEKRPRRILNRHDFKTFFFLGSFDAVFHYFALALLLFSIFFFVFCPPAIHLRSALPKQLSIFIFCCFFLVLYSYTLLRCRESHFDQMLKNAWHVCGYAY